MHTERSRREITTPKKYKGFHMGKLRDIISPRARPTNSNHLDDDNLNLNINQGGSDGEKIKILEEQVSSKDEEISNLKKEIEQLKKGCSKCIINAGAEAVATAEEKEKEEEEEVVSVNDGADTEETNSDAKIKQLETKVNSLEGIMNEGFNNLTVMIGNIQGNTKNVNDTERQQQQQQLRQGEQQQRQHQTVNRIQFEGRNQLQPQRNNNNSTCLNQLRQVGRIILYYLNCQK